MSDSKSKYFRILSIDGGGIRGIIPAMILNRIEQGTRNEDGKDGSICDVFDLIAGTSTGGIIALALTMPKLTLGPYEPDSKRKPKHTANDLIELYKSKGEDIFDRSFLRSIWSVAGYREEMYSSKGIEKVLKKYFENTPLKDAITPVLIPTYDMRGTRRLWKAREEASKEEASKKEKPPKSLGGHPRFFKSESAKCNPDEDYLMRDVARATSAAPTYFEPHDTKFKLDHDDILDEDERFETLVDGGIFANNPAMCAYAEAIRLDQEARSLDPKKPLIGDRQILLVSLGTGELTKQLGFRKARDWGKLEWIDDQTIFNMIFDGASDTVHYQLDQLLNSENDQRYYRFQAPLKQGLDKMDDTTLTNLSSLDTVANDLIRDKQADLTALCEKLQETQS